MKLTLNAAGAIVGIIVIIAAALLVASAARADDDITAKKLVEMYRGSDRTAELVAVSYAAGAALAYTAVNSAMMMGKGGALFCPPPTLKIDAALTISTLEQYMKKNAQAASSKAPAAMLMMFAYMDTFPCNK